MTKTSLLAGSKTAASGFCPVLISARTLPEMPSNKVAVSRSPLVLST